jgi:hypothetical protein
LKKFETSKFHFFLSFKLETFKTGSLSPGHHFEFPLLPFSYRVKLGQAHLHYLFLPQVLLLAGDLSVEPTPATPWLAMMEKDRRAMGIIKPPTLRRMGRSKQQILGWRVRVLRVWLIGDKCRVLEV